MNQYSLMIVLMCIYIGQSFPFDMNESEKKQCIDKLLSQGYIEEDLSDAVTGYTETKKGDMLCKALAEFFYDLRSSLKN